MITIRPTDRQVRREVAQRWWTPVVMELAQSESRARAFIRKARYVSIRALLNRNDTCFASITKRVAIAQVSAAFADARRVPDVYRIPQVARDLDGQYCWIGFQP